MMQTRRFDGDNASCEGTTDSTSTPSSSTSSTGNKGSITASIATTTLVLVLLLLYYSGCTTTSTSIVSNLRTTSSRSSFDELLLQTDTNSHQHVSYDFEDNYDQLLQDTDQDNSIITTNQNNIYHQHHRALTHRHPPAPIISSDPNDCDRSIDVLASQPGSRIRMFILYHNEYGDTMIRNFSCNYTRPWVESVKMNITKYFEYYAYHSIFSNMTEHDFKDVDYVLVTGYRTIIPFNIFNKRHLIEYTLEIGFISYVMKFLKAFPQYQIVPFQYDAKPVNVTLPKAHGDATMPAMWETLATLGWTSAELEKAMMSDVFYRNSYAVTPKEFLRASKLMSRLITAVDNNKTLDALYRHNAYYSINKPLTMKAFGAPHYQLHCFVFERILSILYRHYEVPMYKESFSQMLKKVNFNWNP